MRFDDGEGWALPWGRALRPPCAWLHKDNFSGLIKGFRRKTQDKVKTFFFVLLNAKL